MNQHSESLQGLHIIQAVADNLEQSLNELYLTVKAPSIYHVYLHKQDYEELRGLFPSIREEAKIVLNQRLQRMQKAEEDQLHQRGFLARLARSGRPRSPRRYEPMMGDFFLSFYVYSAPDFHPLQIKVDSLLTPPEQEGFLGGSPTVSLSTVSVGGRSRVTERSELNMEAVKQRLNDEEADIDRQILTRLEGFRPGDTVAPSREETSGVSGLGEMPQAPTEGDSGNPPTRARLQFKDETGPRSFLMERDEIAIGRGGIGYWVDIKLQARKDISRVHCKIRRDTAGRFWIRDLSSLGTTVDGELLPSSVRRSGPQVEDLMEERPLDSQAQIELADVLTLGFEVLP